MKKENGITMLSLIIYVLLMIFVVAAISNITASFYKNVNDFDTESESAVAYSKFNMFFLNDIKKDNIEIEDYKDNYIILALNGEEIQYSIQNNALYRNKVKICENVNNASITVNDGNKITINLKIGDYQKVTTYVIENNEFTNNNVII